MMRDAFTRAYKDGQWHNGSGSGSSPANTAVYRTFVEGYMKGAGVRSVLDVGCGDWQFSRLIDWSGLDRYIGIDLVDDVILANTLKYFRAHSPVITFTRADFLEFDRPPSVDLVLVKDLLQHWPDAAIHELGRRLIGTGALALITYDLDTGPHRDTGPGGYRGLDLTTGPFLWPVRERLRYESVSHEGTVKRTKVVMELML
jgi:SAM-dependent methyltransferase